MLLLIWNMLTYTEIVNSVGNPYPTISVAVLFLFQEQTKFSYETWISKESNVYILHPNA